MADCCVHDYHSSPIDGSPNVGTRRITNETRECAKEGPEAEKMEKQLSSVAALSLCMLLPIANQYQVMSLAAVMTISCFFYYPPLSFVPIKETGQ